MEIVWLWGWSVYYEFYIDQFLLEQLLADGLLLLLASMLLREHLSPFRLLLGSAAGAGAELLLLMLGKPRLGVLAMAVAGLTAFGRCTVRQFAGKLAALLFVTVCFGGTLQALTALWGLPAMAAAAAGAGVLSAGIRWCRRKRYLDGGYTQVTLYWEMRQLTIRGFVDTGNHLEEPLTGRPVSILEQQAADRLLPQGWEEQRGFFLIPYHTVGNGQGWMRAVTLDRMIVGEGKGQTVVERPVLALGCGRLSGQGEFELLLHPAHAAQCGTKSPLFSKQ